MNNGATRWLPVCRSTHLLLFLEVLRYPAEQDLRRGQLPFSPILPRFLEVQFPDSRVLDILPGNARWSWQSPVVSSSDPSHCSYFKCLVRRGFREILTNGLTRLEQNQLLLVWQLPIAVFCVERGPGQPYFVLPFHQRVEQDVISRTEKRGKRPNLREYDGKSVAGLHLTHLYSSVAEISGILVCMVPQNFGS